MAAPAEPEPSSPDSDEAIIRAIRGSRLASPGGSDRRLVDVTPSRAHSTAISFRNARIRLFEATFEAPGGLTRSIITVKKFDPGLFRLNPDLDLFYDVLSRMRKELPAATGGRCRIPEILAWTDDPPLEIRDFIDGADGERLLLRSDRFARDARKDRFLDDVAMISGFLATSDLRNIPFQSSVKSLADLRDAELAAIDRAPEAIPRDHLRRELQTYLREMPQGVLEARRGLATGDFQAKNIVVDDQGRLTIIDMKPQLITACLGPAFFAVNLMANRLRNPDLAALGFLRFYLGRYVSRLHRHCGDFITVEQLQLALIIASLVPVFSKRRRHPLVKPLVKRMYLRDIQELLTGRYCGISLNAVYARQS